MQCNSKLIRVSFAGKYLASGVESRASMNFTKIMIILTILRLHLLLA